MRIRVKAKTGITTILRKSEISLTGIRLSVSPDIWEVEATPAGSPAHAIASEDIFSLTDGEANCVGIPLELYVVGSVGSGDLLWTDGKGLYRKAGSGEDIGGIAITASASGKCYAIVWPRETRPVLRTIIADEEIGPSLAVRQTTPGHAEVSRGHSTDDGKFTSGVSGGHALAGHRILFLYPQGSRSPVAGLPVSQLYRADDGSLVQRSAVPAGNRTQHMGISDGFSLYVQIGQEFIA